MSLVTSIDLVAGGAPVHITVADQNGKALPPAEIAWSAPPAGVTITPDATGFEFALAADAAPGNGEVAATYSGALAAAPVAGGPLALVEVVMVTALQYLSP